VDISKFMDLIGLGDDKPEDLESAMETQILPDIQNGKRPLNRATPEGSKAPLPEELQAPVGDLPDHVKFAKVGRCPSCGDQIISHTIQPCAWCDTPCHPDKDGFHLVHIALGSFQERHCFCCDDCYEAFRRMYPARVHRNCYERSCEDCTYCIKRYTEEADGFPGTEPPTAPQDPVAPEKA
jgi:hypothetical protein